jgi:hypothetical protein
LQQLSHLQDVHFVIHTDHENLTRAYSTGSAKFFREFSYTIVHVKGEENVVADSLSRLCHDYLHDDESEQALAHEQLQRIPAGSHSLMAETFELIQRAHNYVVGHHGVQRTLDKLRRQGVRFEGMRALVKQFIEFCQCCQKMSRIAPAIQATPFTMAT